MSRTQETYVIVGFGWVGQANALALKLLGFDVAYFDPGEPAHHYSEHAGVYASINRLGTIGAKDSEHTWYIVCVGDRVSDDGVQDISNIEKALESLKELKGGVILRSTILPDLLKDLRFDYYMPEFLHEKKAVDECVNPYFFVLGTRGATREPSVFNLWRTKAYKVFEGTPRDASFIKYLSNLWNSVRIAFVNEFGDALGRPASKEDLAGIERVIDFLFDGRNYMRYGKAFGGHCLPKDTRAFTRWYGKQQPLSLLSGVYESNTKHATLEANYPLMPEWYSEWPDRHISGWKALSELVYAIKKNVRRPFRWWQRGARTHT